MRVTARIRAAPQNRCALRPGQQPPRQQPTHPVQDAAVVHEHVDPPGLCDDLLDHALDLAVVRHVQHLQLARRLQVLHSAQAPGCGVTFAPRFAYSWASPSPMPPSLHPVISTTLPWADMLEQGGLQEGARGASASFLHRGVSLCALQRRMCTECAIGGAKGGAAQGGHSTSMCNSAPGCRQRASAHCIARSSQAAAHRAHHKTAEVS